MRVAGDPAKAAPPIRALLAGADRTLPIFDVKPLDVALADSIAPRRFNLLLLGAFPVCALFAAIWWFPIGATTNYLFWHLLLVSLGFYAAYALYSMPLNGLIVEATDDKAQDLASARALRALEPRLLLVGHGPPKRDPVAAMDRAIARAS